ncbi:MAG TPA: GAF domain-containing protein [Terriglobales bacterium]|nr:GAF domain-containing protein [Terriglobales bacterium]
MDHRQRPARATAAFPERRAITLRPGLHGRLVGALSSCASEADLVQVLSDELRPLFGYDTIDLQVLEREGWYHSLAIERGVLRDVRRLLLVESFVADCYRDPRVRVVEHPDTGSSRRRRTSIWVPVLHGGRPIGAVSYELSARREVPADELALLEAVHAHLGPIVSNAHLNELTRNQAVSLGALNAIARALSATHDEQGVVSALLHTLGALIPVDQIELAVLRDGSRARLLVCGPGADVGSSSVPAGSRRLDWARPVLESGHGELEWDAGPDAPLRSSATAPLVEGGSVRGALRTRTRQPGAYEESTLAFLQQVADQAALALRNAWSYEAIEAQRRRLEVVNAVGRRLASTLDRWSTMRILREELARYLPFDVFALAAVAETPDGPVAEAYVWDSGREVPSPPVPLASAGPSREAYETGQPVLIRRATWARALETRRRAGGRRIVGEGVVVDVTRPGRHQRVVARSLIWVPVRHGEEITALLTIQSYRADVFDEWHAQVLQDVATYVGLSLANAEHLHAAQADRHRLSALHLLELSVAGAADEAEITQAMSRAIGSFLDARILVFAYFDQRNRVTGYCADNGVVRYLEPVEMDRTRFFGRLTEERTTIAEAVPNELRKPLPGEGWPTWGPLIPSQMLLVPLFNENRVVGAVSAQRMTETPFTPEEIQLLESAAPVISIALRTVRLLRMNETAQANSLRLQMVAGLAGHDLDGVLASVAEQAREMMEATAAACWAFDDEGRVAAQAVRGVGDPGRVLRWSGRTIARTWTEPPQGPVAGIRGRTGWALVPLWYGDRLVGALGSLHGASGVGEALAAIGDFGQHAAIAIENARLAAETRGRIHVLEAVAGFANLDLTRPERARAEIGRLVEDALAGSHGAIWLLEGSAMVRRSGGGPALRVAAPQPGWWMTALMGGKQRGAARRLRGLLGSPARAQPVIVDEQVVGMITADVADTSPSETRRAMAVLAGQAQIVLTRLALVAEINRQKEMLETVMRHSPVGVVLEDEAGNVQYANSEIERIYGVAAATLVGTPADLLLERPDAVVLSDPDAEPGRPLEVRLDATNTVVQVRRVPVPGSAGKPDRVLSLHEDVTQERAVLEAKDLMLRAIGHEVRSPAAAMRSTIAGLLQWGTVMEADQRHSLIIEAYEQSERLLSLVENQLIIARLEGHRFEPNRAPTALTRSMEQVLTVLRSRYGSRVDVVDVRLSPDLPDAHCEPTHLDQVLSNLISNALEYPRARHIRVTGRVTGEWLEVTVADDGAGLPPDRVARLFAKTGPAGQNRSRGGLGLGLYLCHLVVERSFGGRIWLETTGTSGTTFRFTVPALATRTGPSLRAAQ